MSPQRPAVSVSLVEYYANLLSERELAPRARTIARQASELCPGAAVVVYVVLDQGAPSWTAKAHEGEVALEEQTVAYEAGTLGALAERREPVVFNGTDLAREDFAHLNLRRTISALAYIPITIEDTILGAIEIISYGAEITDSAIEGLEQVADMGAIAIATAIQYENERNSSLQSITRMTELYDLEKVFHSILELNNLLPIVCSKIQELMEAQAVNLWLVEGDDLLLIQRGGEDSTTEVGQHQKAGEGIAGDVSEEGEAVFISDTEDERLVRRNINVEEGAVYSIVAVPLTESDSLVGVLEVINRIDGVPYDDDDLFTMTQVAESVSSSLHNASLLEAERKVEILEALVAVSQEITSTLNLDRVLETVVNHPQAVIPYERAALGMDERGSIHIRAISGTPEVIPTDENVKRLQDMLRWVAGTREEVFVTQHQDEIDAEREEVKEKFKTYFEASGSRAFYALPLSDDQGALGVLSFESSDPDFLTDAHFEMLKVLASQTTVALRNASLYKEVPFIGLLEPVLAKKRKFLALEKSRRTSLMVLAAATVIFLVAVPFPMRVDGEAQVAPAREAIVQPEMDGVVSRVHVREGDKVTKGTVLAEMEDWEQRGALASAEAKYNMAVADANRALSQGDSGVGGQKRLEAQFWSSELSRARERLAHTKLRAPIDGVVATAHVEDLAGRKVDAGTPLVQLVDTASAQVDVAIPESDIALIQDGQTAGVKLEGFPTRTFRGSVVVVSPKSDADKDRRIFYARVDVPNDDGSLRSGMQGRSKISVGWHPAGYTLFRDLGMWFWTKWWNWFGW